MGFEVEEKEISFYSIRSDKRRGGDIENFSAGKPEVARRRARNYGLLFLFNRLKKYFF